MAKKSLTDRFAQVAERLYIEIRSQPAEEWSEIELTMPQFRTLILLSDGPKRMGDIAAYLGTVQSSASSVVDRVVKKGLVQRLQDSTDRRVVLCRLTALGAQELERLWRIRRTRFAAVADLLTTQELETVVAAMEVLAVAMGRQAYETPR